MTTGCGETIFNHPIISSQQHKVGIQYTLDCVEGCKATGDKRYLIGSDKYVDSSPLCITALHAGAIDEHGGRFMIEILAGEVRYKGADKNGLKSKEIVKASEFALMIHNLNKKIFVPFNG